MSAIKAIAQFTKKFSAMNAQGAKSAETVHAVGLEVLEHFKTHQDVGLVNLYFQALPKGHNFKAVAQWLLKYSALRLNSGEDKGESFFKFAKGKPHDVEGAKANPFWTMQNASTPNVNGLFDIKAKMIDLVKRAAKADKLEGDFKALRAAAIAMGVPESELPANTEKALQASQVKTGKTIAKSSKENKEPAAVDPLDTVTA